MSEFYRAWSKRERILENSSSGGVFTELAELIIADHGVVVGACQDQSTYELKHIIVDRSEDLWKIQRSKYYQSEAFVTFKAVKELLEAGRKVLFSGTACQIAGLYAVLENVNTDQLITVDVLCHGVPSRKTFQEYVRCQERKYGRKIEEIHFRTKRIPWENGGGTSMELHFKGGEVEILRNNADEFLMAFNHNLILRESCYMCKFAGINRISDITLCDYWGIDRKTVPDIAMKRGVSLMLVNTDNGKEMGKRLMEKNILECAAVSPDDALPYNGPLIGPSKRNPKRDIYLQKRGTKEFNKLVREILCSEYRREKIKRGIGLDRIRKIKQILREI
ncbi:MAG: Coenzyme F420 hydrogenase/dehydrogenase, beta subunit C-terminal domain [Lachnospiraceae bacterium]|nr:Coenzyme F420 hydrogenase/dehydrogenase, beta subunit C-terminal domain [Lachnospiraceae bacterium]